jgi:hypothetical protein
LKAVHAQIGGQQFLIFGKPERGVAFGFRQEKLDFLEVIVGRNHRCQFRQRGRFDRELQVGRDLGLQGKQRREPGFQLLEQFVVGIGRGMATHERSQLRGLRTDLPVVPQKIPPGRDCQGGTTRRGQSFGPLRKLRQIRFELLKNRLEFLRLRMRQDGIQIPNQRITRHDFSSSVCCKTRYRTTLFLILIMILILIPKTSSVDSCHQLVSWRNA